MITHNLTVPEGIEKGKKSPHNYSANRLVAEINEADFSATIIGGRYDEGPSGNPEWIRRSWGRGPLPSAGDKHTIIFISINWDIPGKNTYNLAEENPATLHFTNLFPPEDGNEFEYLVPVKKGTLTITHNKETFICEGEFDFEVDIEQPDGSSRHFEVKKGVFLVGPTD